MPESNCDVFVEVEFDDAALKRSLAGIQTCTKNMGKEISAALNGLESAFEGFRSLIKTLIDEISKSRPDTSNLRSLGLSPGRSAQGAGTGKSVGPGDLSNLSSSELADFASVVADGVKHESSGL